MTGSASAVLACARAVDAGRRTAKGIRAGCPDPFAGWRSGAAERVQAIAGGVEPVIYPCVRGIGHHTATGHRAAAARSRRARAAPRRPARAAALDAGASDAHPRLRAPARAPGVAEAALPRAPED